MSYCGVVYRISFKRLGALCGSKAVQFIEKLTPYLEPEELDDDDEDEDENGEPLPSAVDALRQVVMGEPLMSDYPEPYGVALAAIYGRIGHMLDNSSVAPVSWEHLSAADAALAAEGVPEAVRFSNLFYRGLPTLGMDSPEPFPTFGYLSPEEVAGGRGSIKSIRWFKYPNELHPVLHQLDAWLNEAAGEEQGLVGYYG